MEDWLWFDSGLPFRSMHGMCHYHEEYVNPAGQWQIRSMKLTRVNIEWT